MLYALAFVTGLVFGVLIDVADFEWRIRHARRRNALLPQLPGSGPGVARGPLDGDGPRPL